MASNEFFYLDDDGKKQDEGLHGIILDQINLNKPPIEEYVLLFGLTKEDINLLYNENK